VSNALSFQESPLQLWDDLETTVLKELTGNNYSRPRFPPPVHLCQADSSKTATAAPKPRKGSIIVGAKSRVRHDVEMGIGSIQRRCGVA
jgi:hypothetical protein